MRLGRSQKSGGARNWWSLTPAEIIRAELWDDEELIWADAPADPNAHFSRSIPQAVFGLFFFGFSVFWIWGASRMTGQIGASDPAFATFEWLFPLFGFPFAFVGLTMILGPVLGYYKARSTVYALTSQRLIIKHHVPTEQTKSYALEDVVRLHRKGAARGTGSLYFYEEMTKGRKGGYQRRKIGFIGIDDPLRLENAIRDAIKKLEQGEA